MIEQYEDALRDAREKAWSKYIEACNRGHELFDIFMAASRRKAAAELERSNARDAYDAHKKSYQAALADYHAACRECEQAGVT
jgi:hypothetical protein